MTENYLLESVEIKNCTCGGNPILCVTPISHVYFVSCSECGKYSVNEDEENEYENYNDEAEHLFMDGGGYY